MAVQLRRDLLPVLEEAGVDLLAVSIGTHERSKDFARETGFPVERLFADRESACYDALRFNKSLANFSRKSTPQSLMDRWKKNGASDLREVLARWKPWIPPKPEQGFQQGGAFVFDFSESSVSKSETRDAYETAYRFYDPSTGVHVPFDALLEAVGVAPLGTSAQAALREDRAEAR